MPDKIEKTDEEWRKLLTDEQYGVLRERRTEAPDSGKYYHFKKKGIFVCAACGNELFGSDTKFESGTGWPSFWDAASSDSVETEPDDSVGRGRIEVHCARCGGHLGHVFADGPDPSGMRYCINSAALDFKEGED
jgi:peptide-methionine (R)-S-oxide reductase